MESRGKKLKRRIAKEKKVKFLVDKYTSEEVFFTERKKPRLKRKKKHNDEFCPSKSELDEVLIDSKEKVSKKVKLEWVTSNNFEVNKVNDKNTLSNKKADSVAFNFNEFFHSFSTNVDLNPTNENLKYSVKTKNKFNKKMIKGKAAFELPTNGNCSNSFPKLEVKHEIEENMDCPKVEVKREINQNTTDNSSNESDFESNTDVPEFEMIETYDISEGKIVIVHQNKPLSVFGYMKLKVLYGTVNIFGEDLSVNSKETNIYSPRGSAIFCINNITSNSKIKVLISELTCDLKKYESLKDVVVMKNSSVLLFKKLNDFKMSFLQKYISQQIFPKNLGLIPVVLNPPGNWNTLKISSEWNNILLQIRNNSRIMIVGGKGVGKSTLLRYLINKSIRNYKKVRIIDLDPGQAEFTVPGCISVVTIEEPVFGPNYTHLTKTERSMLCSIDVGSAHKKYINCVEELLAYYNKHTNDEFPTLINNMGFNQKIGLDITCCSIAHIKPDVLIQINSKEPKKNYLCKLDKEYVLRKTHLIDPSISDNLDYTVLEIQSETDNSNGWQLQPRQIREMCLLSYFGQMMVDETMMITSNKVPMYEIRLSAIKILNIREEEVSPAAANANVVALCRKENYNLILEGWGIVKGVDRIKDLLVLITPEKINNLKKVTALVVGVLTLPPSIYMNTSKVTGHIPYVMDGELMSFGKRTKRVYFPNKK